MKTIRWFACFLAITAAAQQTEDTFRFSTTTQLVVVDIEVRDRDGNPIEGLTAEDFEILEDGKPQRISVFEYQRLSDQTVPEPAAPVAAEVPKKQGVITGSRPGQVRYRNSRLMVLFFDLSSMPPEDQVRARTSAEKFVQENLTPTDWVAVMAFGNQLTVLEDFTNDKDRLLEVIDRLRIGEASEMAEELAAGEEETGEDTGAAFTADETEFNIFNTD
ncbi:MAG: VWA domain-containing protein, partial [bacterium]|nr:VWA domain-containing protein [bacterium]